VRVPGSCYKSLVAAIASSLQSFVFYVTFRRPGTLLVSLDKCTTVVFCS